MSSITTWPFVEYLCWEQRQQSKSGKHHHPAGSTCQNEMPKYSFLDVHRSSSKIPPNTRWLLMLFTMPALHRYTLRELFLWHMQLIGLSSRDVSCLTMNYTVSAPLKNRLQLTTSYWVNLFLKAACCSGTTRYCSSHPQKGLFNQVSIFVCLPTWHDPSWCKFSALKCLCFVAFQWDQECLCQQLLARPR